jgi:hypothetical protein
MTVFGDKDPEDAYDAGDPLDLRLAVIERTVTALRDAPADSRRRTRRDDLIRVLLALDHELFDVQNRLMQLRFQLEEL